MSICWGIKPNLLIKQNKMKTIIIKDETNYNHKYTTKYMIYVGNLESMKKPRNRKENFTILEKLLEVSLNFSEYH